MRLSSPYIGFALLVRLALAYQCPVQLLKESAQFISKQFVCLAQAALLVDGAYWKSPISMTTLSAMWTCRRGFSKRTGAP